MSCTSAFVGPWTASCSTSNMAEPGIIAGASVPRTRTMRCGLPEASLSARLRWSRIRAPLSAGRQGKLRASRVVDVADRHHLLRCGPSRLYRSWVRFVCAVQPRGMESAGDSHVLARLPLTARHPAGSPPRSRGPRSIVLTSAGPVTSRWRQTASPISADNHSLGCAHDPGVQSGATVAAAVRQRLAPQAASVLVLAVRLSDWKPSRKLSRFESSTPPPPRPTASDLRQPRSGAVPGQLQAVGPLV
jgi:hypothetical protein